MSVIIFTNVVMRYVTSDSLEWAEEVSRHMMIWLTFLGAGPVLRYGGHIAVENLQDALPRAGAIAMRAIVAAAAVRASSASWSGTAGSTWSAPSSRLTAVTQIPFAVHLQRDGGSAACC